MFGKAGVMDRPELAGMVEIFDDLKRRMAEFGDVQRRMLRLTGTAVSDDGMIRVLVGPRGQLLELDIDPRVLRRPDSRALAATIVATTRLAVADVSGQVRAITEESLPSDMRFGSVGDLDIGKLMFADDAELRSHEGGHDE
jgi:DNA-binding protein YbaB